MNLRFHIDYKTVFGEELVLNVMNSATDNASGDSRRSKGGIMPAQVRMCTQDGEHWTCEVNTSAKIANGCVIDYFYSVETDGAEKRHEWLTEAHRLELTPACSGNMDNKDNSTSGLEHDKYCNLFRTPQTAVAVVGKKVVFVVQVVVITTHRCCRLLFGSKDTKIKKDYHLFTVYRVYE